MRKAFGDYSVKEISAHCDKVIAEGKTPSREMFLEGIGKKSRIELSRERIKASAEAKAARLKKPHTSQIKLYPLPIQKLAAKIKPESVDLILTDPPYDRAGVPLYSELSKFAGDVLKPGGHLLALSGSCWLPEIIRRICEDKRLKWCWHISYSMRTGGPRNWDRFVFSAAKIILWLVKDHYPKKYWVHNEVYPPPPPKKTSNEFHKWGQTVAGMEAILGKNFGFPGELICDPFLGAGSTALAAVRRRCDFIGGDIDPENIRVTEGRLAKETERLAKEKKPVPARNEFTG